MIGGTVIIGGTTMIGETMMIGDTTMASKVEGRGLGLNLNHLPPAFLQFPD